MEIAERSRMTNGQCNGIQSLITFYRDENNRGFIWEVVPKDDLKKLPIRITENRKISIRMKLTIRELDFKIKGKQKRFIFARVEDNVTSEEINHVMKRIHDYKNELILQGYSERKAICQICTAFPCIVYKNYTFPNFVKDEDWQLLLPNNPSICKEETYFFEDSEDSLPDIKPELTKEEEMTLISDNSDDEFNNDASLYEHYFESSKECSNDCQGLNDDDDRMEGLVRKMERYQRATFEMQRKLYKTMTNHFSMLHSRIESLENALDEIKYNSSLQVTMSSDAQKPSPVIVTKSDVSILGLPWKDNTKLLEEAMLDEIKYDAFLRVLDTVNSSGGFLNNIAKVLFAGDLHFRLFVDKPNGCSKDSKVIILGREHHKLHPKFVQALINRMIEIKKVRYEDAKSKVLSFFNRSRRGGKKLWKEKLKTHKNPEIAKLLQMNERAKCWIINEEAPAEDASLEEENEFIAKFKDKVNESFKNYVGCLSDSD